MPHSSPSRLLLSLARSFGKLDLSDPLTQCLAPRLSRTLASHTSLPSAQDTEASDPRPSSLVLTTVHRWPEIEPTKFAWYNERLLNVPLRKDILHRAVIFEADGSRQGTAWAKWRGDVHGSNRKIQPQKGLGRARAGDKKSPIRRGGGKAFGPHPRDFSTELPRKVYDRAWRTALSHRYRKGELVVLQNNISLPENAGGRFLNNLFETLQWGKGNGRSMLVTSTKLRGATRLKNAMAEVGEHGLIKDIWDVDVKDLLETGRVVIEKGALDALLFAHASDMGLKSGLDFAQRAPKEEFILKASISRRVSQATLDDDEEEEVDGEEGFDYDEPEAFDHGDEDDQPVRKEFDMEAFEAQTFAERSHKAAR